MISFGKVSFQRLHRTFRRLRQKKATANEQDSQVEEEMMEKVVMDAEGSLQQKPRECDVMDIEESMHQKPRDVCITEDTASIDMGWFEHTKLNRVKKRHSMSVAGWRLRLGITQKGFCETVAEVMDAEAEGEDEVRPSKS